MPLWPVLPVSVCCCVRCTYRTTGESLEMKHGSLISPDEAVFGFGTSKPVFEATSAAAGDAADLITVPDAHLLFSGEFKHVGNDLKIIGEDGKSFVVTDYFKTDKHPTLRSPEGATLTGDLVDLLAGPLAPGQYAQAGAPQPGAAEAVGRVAVVTGNVTVIRNGVAITVNAGDAILKNDIVQTGAGATCGVAFNDGSTFNIAAGARLAINEFVYDPNGSANASLVTLIQGAATFVAGQIAKTGDMKVATPVATMGIRGTAVILDTNALDGRVTISVIDQRDNKEHNVEVYDRAGNLIATATSIGGRLVLTPTATLEVIASFTNKTPEQVALEFAAFQSVLSSYDAAKQFFPNLPDHTDVNPKDIQTAQGTGIQPSNTNLPSSNPVFGDKIQVVEIEIKKVSDTSDGDDTDDTDDDSDIVLITEVTLPSNTQPFVLSGPTVTRIAAPDDAHAFAPDMSADGRWIVFDPLDDLEDQPQFEMSGKIFIYDRFDPDGGPIEISALVPEGYQDDFFGGASISLDGRFIVFQGSNEEDEFGQSVVFLYDNRPAEERPNPEASRITVLGEGGNAHIDGGGNFIVMETGGDLVVVDRDGNEILSIDAEHDGPGVWSPEIDATGRFITFWTAAEEIEIEGEEFYLVGGLQPDVEPVPQVFLYDRLTGTLEAVSALTHLVDPYEGISPNAYGDAGSGALSTENGDPIDTFDGNVGDFPSSISANGQYVVFQSNATNLDGGEVETDTYADIFIYDRFANEGAGAIIRISNANGGAHDGGSYRPVISPDGDFVIFSSDAGLVAADTNENPDTYIWSRATGIVLLVSANLFGFAGNGNSSFGAAISAGGIFYAFGSTATNLTPGSSDPNGPTSDIYVLDAFNGTRGLLIEHENSSDVIETHGRIVFTDLNGGHTVEVLNQPTIGHVTAKIVQVGPDLAGAIEWTYTIDKRLAAHVPEGDTETLPFTLRLIDGENVVPIEVNVTIIGTNDAPEIALPGETYLTFDGDDYAASSAPASTQANNVTFEAWIRWDGSAGNGLQTLFYNGNTSDAGYGLMGDGDNGSLAFNVLAGGRGFMYPNASIPPDEWHHVALVRDNGTFKFYLDGIEKTLTDAGTEVNDISGSDQTFVGGNPGNANENFYGAIAEVRLWDIVRAQQEIADARFDSLDGDEDGLVGYWPLSEGTGDFAPDHAAPATGLLFHGEPEWIVSAGGVATFEEGSSTTLAGLSVSDVDGGTDTYTVNISAGGGGLSLVNNHGVEDTSAPFDTIHFQASLDTLNDILRDGVTYTDPTPEQYPEGFIDTVKLAVTDANGGTDETNFIFSVFGENGATLPGTSGKDVLFSTGHSDTFAFSFGESGIGQDTIIDFDVGGIDIEPTDVIEFTDGPTSLDDLHIRQDGADTVIDIGSDDSIRLAGIDHQQLQAANFVFYVT